MKVSLKPLLLIITLVLTIFLTSSLVLAADEEATTGGQVELLQIKKEDINPDNGFGYFVKRLKEKIKLLSLFTNPTAKADYDLVLVNKRLAELKYVVDKKDADKIEVSSQRYSSTVGDLTNVLTSNNNLKEQKEKVKDELSKHLPLIEKLRGAYDYPTAEWRFMKQDADYLEIYLSKLSK